ncbi:MAG: GGDEF domain-containing protein, partial [Chromatiaceae bacterium]|nr:GGDEF domain-containing protein [Chromatiaceae bacterium]
TRELADKNLQLEALSTTDWLTKISNRIKLESDFSAQLDRARHFGTSFAVLLCDVDYFKRINDTFGHQAGDQVLVELAGLLKSTMRQSDQVGRWGGEEFMLILPETSLDAALTLAERLRLLVSQHSFPGGAASVTISVGVSAYRADDTQESLTERADQALYRAKSEGRNRVCD